MVCGQAMESYSHTTVPSRLSTILLSPVAACTPEVRVRLPVSSFNLANSSPRVISYYPCATWPFSTLSSGTVTMPTSHLLSSSSLPARYML
jgi:hypothetical protein